MDRTRRRESACAEQQVGWVDRVVIAVVAERSRGRSELSRKYRLMCLRKTDRLEQLGRTDCHRAQRYAWRALAKSRPVRGRDLNRHDWSRIITNQIAQYQDDQVLLDRR